VSSSLETPRERLLRKARVQIWELVGERGCRVELLNAGARASLFRCFLRGRCSVIAKVYCKSTKGARHEWDALRFLAAHAPLIAPIAPRPLERSKDGRVILMEDLEGETLTSLLERDGGLDAKRPLLRVAHALGLLHGTAAKCLNMLPRSLRNEYIRQSDESETLRDRVRALLQRAAVAPAAGFDIAWQELVERLRSPGEFLTFTHGDLAPSNVLMTADGPKLLDFEFAGARSSLYDALFWEAIVPFPRALARAMTQKYRDTLTGDIPKARDDDRFRHELSTLKTHRLFWSLTFRLDHALASRDSDWVPGWPLRPAYLFYLRNYVVTCRRLDSLEPLLQTAEVLYARLRKQWAENASYPENFMRGARRTS
jgi:serine/threonine protein kinase